MTGCVGFSVTSTLYIGISVGLSVYNKYILNIHNFPNLLLTCQFLFLFVFSSILTFTILKPKLRESSFWISRISWKTYLYRLCPLGVLYGFDIIFTTSAIASGPVAFVEMIKAAVPTIVLLFTFISGNSDEGRIDCMRILSVLIITLGQIWTHFTEVDFNWLCFIWSFAALTVSSLKLIVIEKLVSSHRFKNNKLRRLGLTNTTQTIETSEVDVNNLNLSNKKNRENDSYQNNTLDKNNNNINNNDNASDTEEEQLLSQVIEYTAGDIAMMPVSADILEESKESNDNQNDIENGKNNIDGLEFSPNEAVALSDDKNDKDVDRNNEYNQNNINKIDNIDRDDIQQQHQQPHRNERIHSVLALFYFMPIACALSLILYATTEEKKVRKSGALESSFWPIIGGYFISSLIALALNWCELFFIRHWTALTFAVLAGVKLIVIIGASWLILHHNITLKSLLGYIMVVLGVMLYNFSKIRAKRMQPRQPQIKDNNNNNSIVSTVDFDVDPKTCLKDLISKLRQIGPQRNKQYGKVWSDFPDPYESNNDDGDTNEMGYTDNY